MYFIVGLGNPGKKFENTRHNVGFDSLDFFALKNNFPKFCLDKKSNSLISKQFINGQKVLLIKPQTFMNLSGKSVFVLLDYYNNNKKGFFSFLIQKFKKKEKKSLNNLIVIHDDLDIEVGKIKIVQKRGSGGHNGIKSIIREIKTNDFIRIRIGIKPKIKDQDFKKTAIINFVLGHFKGQEKEKIQKNIQEINNKIKKLILNPEI